MTKVLRNRKIIALAPLLLCFAFAGEKIAIITKIIGKAEYVRNDKLPKNLKRGFIIESGDEISTKKGAFVALVFIDDRSALKIREKSQIVINGKKNARIINKKINLNNGTIRAQVKTSKNFLVQTSVSVASVKGTDFWVISNDKIGDSIIGLEGLVSLSNRISGEKIDIKKGTTGMSTNDGSLQIFKSDPKNTPLDLVQSEGQDKKLEIIFNDFSGKQKKLIIDYK
tara:strand:- start:851 stop:1528 length:678 start_codon:yes stop_codon:yes gene_type:complete